MLADKRNILIQITQNKNLAFSREFLPFIERVNEDTITTRVDKQIDHIHKENEMYKTLFSKNNDNSREYYDNMRQLLLKINHNSNVDAEMSEKEQFKQCIKNLCEISRNFHPDLAITEIVTDCVLPSIDNSTNSINNEIASGIGSSDVFNDNQVSNLQSKLHEINEWIEINQNILNKITNNRNTDIVNEYSTLVNLYTLQENRLNGLLFGKAKDMFEQKTKLQAKLNVFNVKSANLVAQCAMIVKLYTKLLASLTTVRDSLIRVNFSI